MSAPDRDPGTARMWGLFERVIAHDTSPSVGAHRVASDDPRLDAFIEEIARPELEGLGATAARDRAGNLIATFGPRTGTELLLIAYPATHHGNVMADPLLARPTVVEGRTYWVGQGASEGKGPFVSLIDALRRAHDASVRLDGRIVVVVSTEGSSTNDSSNVMFDGMRPLPAATALIIGTENKIALGHRGRADIIVTTTGTARHSSVAAGLPNPIADICRAQGQLAAFAGEWAQPDRATGAAVHDNTGPGSTESHIDGGGRSITPYRLVCGPVAPHTMPERCELALDCRFLPGDDIDGLLSDLRDAIDDEAVNVAFGPVMLPAATDPASVLVATFIESARRAGIDATTFTPPWTFDAGASNSRGIPTILFGPSSDNLAAIDGTDAVSLDMLNQASATLTNVITIWGN